MIKKTIFIMLITAFKFAKADELPVPNFNEAPMKYEDQWGGSLLLGDKTPSEVKFWFNIIGGNYHQCFMVGTAVVSGPETYTYSVPSRRGKFCNLKITIDGISVKLEDPQSQCKKISCGQRAGINGSEFKLAEGLQKNPGDCA